MPRMVTLEPHQYASRQLKAGEEFEAEDLHVPFLTASGRARLMQAQEYNTRRLQAGDQVVPAKRGRGRPRKIRA